jgi:hypothetical protein
MLETEKKLNNEKIKFGRYSVDINRALINYLNVWPIPHIFYIPLKWKCSESMVGYEADFSSDSMEKWLL